MLDTAPTVSAGTRELNVRKLTSTIVDVPTVRKHKLSQTSVTAQSM
jgi:muconate cycloisomerase